MEVMKSNSLSGPRSSTAGCLGLSYHVLNNSKDGDSTKSHGNLFQCLTTQKLIKIFLMSKLNFSFLAPSSLHCPVRCTH